MYGPVIKVYGYTSKGDHSDVEGFVSLPTGYYFLREEFALKEQILPFRHTGSSIWS